MTTPRRNSLGARLGRWTAVSTAISLAIFAATAALILWIGESEEDEEGEGRAAGAVEEEPLEETLRQVGLALAIAAPIGIVLAMTAAHWLARRAALRVDAVIATATRMTADNLGERLPVSPANDELDALAVALNKLFARLEEGVALQLQFAADASHELRSPLAVLASTLEGARRRPRSGEEWEAVTDRALDEVRHMTRLVEALLEFARAGALPRRETVALGEFIDALVDRWRSYAAERGVGLQVDRIAPATLSLDAGMMEIALRNVLTNAIDHSPRGEVVRVECRVGEEHVSVTVLDQGPGVPEALRPRIFDPFVRGDASIANRKSGRAGLGLGLAIARRVLEGHGGGIEIGAPPDGGGMFTLFWPRVQTPSSPRGYS